MNDRVLVLGSGGYLGAAVCRAFAARADVDLTAHYQFPPTIGATPQPGTSWVALDLARVGRSELAALIDEVAPRSVVNCIGITAGTPDQLRAVNVGLTGMILDVLVGVHLVHLGSAAEYGDQPAGTPAREDAVPAPIGPYAEAKLESTRMVLAAAAEGRIRATVLRVFNPVGRDAAPSSLPGRAATLIDAALRTGSGTVQLGSLSSWRDYVDVRDVAAAVAMAATTPPADGVTLNVGRGEAVSSRHLVQRLAVAAGFDGRFVEHDDAGSTRSQGVAWQCANIEAIRHHLGWSPAHDIDAMVQDLWAGVRPVVSGST